MASLKDVLFAIPSVVSSDPWLIATLFDTYFAFFAFHGSLCFDQFISTEKWREPRQNVQSQINARLLWFITGMIIPEVDRASFYQKPWSMD
jgi:hypothetical protein